MFPGMNRKEQLLALIVFGAYYVITWPLDLVSSLFGKQKPR